MARFSVTHANAIAASTEFLNITGDGNIRIAIYDILIGSQATPADQAAQWILNRSTIDGVGGTAITPEPLDPLTVAAVATAFGYDGSWSTPPTVTANSELLMIAMNQRSTVRWVAAPGSELISVATNNAGLILTPEVTTGTAIHDVTILFWE